METSRAWRFSTCLLLGLLLLATTLQNVQGEEESEAPSQCKPFIEKALKEQQKEDVPPDQEGAIVADDSEYDANAGELEPDTGDNAITDSTETQQLDETGVSVETDQTEQSEQTEGTEAASVEQDETNIEIQNEVVEESETETTETTDAEGASVEEMQADQPSDAQESAEEPPAAEEDIQEQSVEIEGNTVEDNAAASTEDVVEPSAETNEAEDVISQEGEAETDLESVEATTQETQAESTETQEQTESIEEPAEASDSTVEGEGDAVESVETTTEADEEPAASVETEAEPEVQETETESVEAVDGESVESVAEETDKIEDGKSAETESEPASEQEAQAATSVEETAEEKEIVKEQEEQPEATSQETESVKESGESVPSAEESEPEVQPESAEAKEVDEKPTEKEETVDSEAVQEPEPSAAEEKETSEVEESKEAAPEEDLTLDIEIPDNLRPRDHIDQLLKLDDSNDKGEAIVNKINEVTLKDLKRLYENAIKPLETLYKYRDLSNRHFGDSEIFSKPLVVFMGPWSGGKSSIVNYLLDNEYNATSLRTGAEPSPAYFNLVMHGKEPEVLDGTQLAADFTFAGLQKFGQGLEERLRGLKLPNKLLEKINIVEIPGILEVRKQVSRVFPFNDACQWFIDRADIIFLVYDPSKLDVGPETEAILDQLKGREHQTRIVLNKADQVKPEELMRVQSALIWNISPLMSSAQPPVMYTTSLWSRPYETWAPVRLLQAQERAFLRDLRSAVDKRIENKISSARRFAVRVRNHAKMVDCYLTTYYNHKSVFGNKKQVAEQIIEHPQDYHIYEGLSTLTNISRYDLPDPDVYRDFFRLNPVYDFQQLSATCTYFRGCPINKLDVAIAYDLPELVGKHKKLVEGALANLKPDNS
ncbi:uncharacterized protein [Atheta coriaria]|uniref:uncharacterized protein isoform X2 n=1 Tax=Dalotia coriaria TaxID=877792 RepID=UPI0031F3D9DB